MSLSPPYTPHTALAVVEIASDSDVSRTLTSHTEIRVIPNLSGKSGTGDRSRERNGTVVKRILTLPCPALHLPEVQHELLIHSIISGGTRVISSATVSILCGNCWRVALVQVYFFAEFQCLPLLSTCSSRALCAAAALKQRGLSRVSSSRCLSLSSRSVVHQSRNRTPSFPSSLSQVPKPRFLWSARASMASPSPAVSSLETEAPQATVTRERRLNPDLQEHLPKPCKHTSSIPSP